MPVIAAEERRRKLARRSNVRIAVQSVADLVGILLANTRQRKFGKTLSRMDVEISVVLSMGVTQRKKQEDASKHEFHKADSLGDSQVWERRLDICELRWQTKIR